MGTSYRRRTRMWLLIGPVALLVLAGGSASATVPQRAALVHGCIVQDSQHQVVSSDGCPANPPGPPGPPGPQGDPRPDRPRGAAR